MGWCRDGVAVKLNAVCSHRTSQRTRYFVILFISTVSFRGHKGIKTLNVIPKVVAFVQRVRLCSAGATLSSNKAIPPLCGHSKNYRRIGGKFKLHCESLALDPSLNRDDYGGLINVNDPFGS